MSKSALLIIDVQQALCTGPWAAFDIDAVVDRINVLSEKARSAGWPIFFIQHEEEDGALKFSADGWQLYSRLAVEPDDMRIRKTATNSFHETELYLSLSAQQITDVVICGLQSEFCIDSTVRGALALGFSVTLVSDAHSTVDNGILTAAQISAHHNVTLANIGSYGVRVEVISAAEMRV